MPWDQSHHLTASWSSLSPCPAEYLRGVGKPGSSWVAVEHLLWWKPGLKCGSLQGSGITLFWPSCKVWKGWPHAIAISEANMAMVRDINTNIKDTFSWNLWLSPSSPFTGYLPRGRQEIGLLAYIVSCSHQKLGVFPLGINLVGEWGPSLPFFCCWKTGIKPLKGPYIMRTCSLDIRCPEQKVKAQGTTLTRSVWACQGVLQVRGRRRITTWHWTCMFRQGCIWMCIFFGVVYITQCT